MVLEFYSLITKQMYDIILVPCLIEFLIHVFSVFILCRYDILAL